MKTQKQLLPVFLILIVLSIILSPLKMEAASPEVSDGGIGNSTDHVQSEFASKKKINDILYPLFATPAINKQGTSLTIKVDTHGKAPANWKVNLHSPEQSSINKEYSLPVRSAEKGSSYWKKDSTVYDVTVDIPKNVPEELYDLNTSYTADGNEQLDTQAHAVKVVKEFKKDFSFIHLTDIHVGSPRNLNDLSYTKEAGFWNPDPEKRWLYLQKTIKEINLQKPDFAVLSGDLVFGQMNPGEYTYEYQEVYRVLQQLSVPVYIVPGNHDGYAQDFTLTDGLKYWNEYFGPRYYSFNYGPYAHFVALNTFDWEKIDRSGSGTVSVPTWGGQVREEQLQWMKDDLANNETKAAPGQMRGLVAHNNPLFQDRDIWPKDNADVQKYWEEYDKKHNPQSLVNLLRGEKLGIKYDQLWHGEGASEVLDLMKQYHLTVGLHGHTHKDQIDNRDGMLFATTTSIELTGDPWIGYRTFQMKNGSLDSSYIYEGANRSLPVYQNGDTASGVMSLQADYQSPNDGTAGNQTATVTNRLNRPITVHVPFYMKTGNYQTSAGVLEKTDDQDGKQKMEVTITVPSNSSQSVTVSPS